MQEENLEEGTLILDEKLKAQIEQEKLSAEVKVAKMRATNARITEMLAELSSGFGLKVCVAAVDSEYDECGVWKSKNVSQFDEMAFSQLMSKQF